MDEKDFELLKVLNETKNITHAANKLYLSQSSLSKRILAIEKELGISLMLRSQKGIHFTPEGEEVLFRTMEASAHLKQMRDSLLAKRDVVCGTLNAGISINFARYTLPDLLAEYRKCFPHVHTNITTNHSRNLYLQMVEGSVDVAILRGEYDWYGEKILLSQEKICAICTHEDQQVNFLDLPFIGHKTDSDFEKVLSRWLRENNYKSALNNVYVDNITTCVEMVQRGIGWAIVPEICLKNFEGYRKPLFFEDGEPLVRSTYIYYSKNAQALPQVREFIRLAIRSNEE